ITIFQVQTSTRTIRNTCAALRTYATSHGFMRIEHYRRLNVAREGAAAKAARDGARVLPTVTPRPHATISVTFQPPANIRYYSPMHVEEETLRQAVSMLSGLHKGHYSSWKAMAELRSVGMIKLLLSMLLKAHDWASISAGKIEIAINSVYTIMMMATIPRVQAELCAPVNLDIEVCGLAVLLNLSDDKMYGDAEAPIVGMCAIIACICPPIEQEGSRK
ncbi:hypothetical protein PFISCL1PPCAC_21440, partial [Pristionchus fissidentatus]